ncbi:hypothetical protein ACFT2C_04635 [Promicromonospora sp. NPDC057138]|uniref:hypothetical protein n=1 Tax=Promicromonospora sp. NPDC057138 TaxID=3346031 RepID=UPI00363D2CD8
MNPRSPYPQHQPQQGHGPRSQPARPSAPASPGTNPAAFDDTTTRRKTRPAKAPVQPKRDQPQITWIRAGDLPTALTGRVLARGVSLHAALIRRALDRPTAAAKKAARAAKGLATRNRTTSAATQEPPGTGRRTRASSPQHDTEGMGI